MFPSLDPVTAQQVDDELMGAEVQYTLEQLMELAGLSVAQCVYDFYSPSPEQRVKVAVICGPGNNGGDGLVAARHLTEFGYDVTVCYPKQGKNPHYARLIRQLESYSIPITESMTAENLYSFDLILDAIFGFSFRGEVRAPFDDVINMLKELKTHSAAKLVSIDVPSGWDVENGDVTGSGVRPDCLVSLTAPKNGTRNFSGKHYVGGRFVPEKMKNKIGSKFAYKGSQQFSII